MKLSSHHFLRKASVQLLTLFFIGVLGCSPPQSSIENQVISSPIGLQMLVAEEDLQPTLRVVLPEKPLTDRSIEILFPEHVTVRQAGSPNSEQLYVFRPGQNGERPTWRKKRQSLEYERTFTHNLDMLARATMQDDGVLLHYRFKNNSDVDYDLIYAPTDPRLTSIFHDLRLERTYVHHEDGFDLLASETPDRLTMPIDQWLPARYLASFSWPVPEVRIEDRDGIPHYHKSRAVDQPFIATVSTDGSWIVASLARETGNVWSNPELTCQHVDPMPRLPAGEEIAFEVKLLVFNGSLEEIFERAIQQRDGLK